MNPRVVYLVQSFRIYGLQMEAFIAGIGQEHADFSFNQQCSSIAWTVGHMAMARNFAATLAGGGVVLDGWAPLFGRGSVPQAASAYPPLAEMGQRFQEAGKSLQEMLPKVTDAVLDGDPPRPPPWGLKTVGEFIGLLTVHEAYHMGQLGLCYKTLTGKTLTN